MVGEEINAQAREPKDPQTHVWLIDPNDGTSAFQKGWRGAAVSIALLRKGLPVLGVVHAYAAKAGRGDLFAWAEGQPFKRNGRTVEIGPAARSEESLTVIEINGCHISISDLIVTDPDLTPYLDSRQAPQRVSRRRSLAAATPTPTRPLPGRCSAPPSVRRPSRTRGSTAC